MDEHEQAAQLSFEIDLANRRSFAELAAWQVATETNREEQ